jgi:hypothetical protein
MKKSIQLIAFLALSTFMVVSCSTEGSDTDSDLQEESSLLLDQDGTSIIQDDGIVFQQLDSRNPNSNQTDEELIRGTRVTIPLFDQSPIAIRVGRWGTVAFSIQVNDADPALCEAPPTEEQVATILEDAMTFLENNNVEITFDGEVLDLESNFRTEGLVIEEAMVLGELRCTYNLPWRYYQNPRPPGDYELVFTANGASVSRTVSWERK